jgi:hypothetical protein
MIFRLMIIRFKSKIASTCFMFDLKTFYGFVFRCYKFQREQSLKRKKVTKFIIGY